MLRPFIVKVSVLGYFPLHIYIGASERYFLWGGAIYLYFILYILLCINNIITNYILLIPYTSLVYVNPLICN